MRCQNFSFGSHLMITATQCSAPIESFIIDLCKRNDHASIQILWLLENYLRDLKITGNKYAAYYLRTARILTAIQKAVFRSDINVSVRKQTKKCLLHAMDHLKTFYGINPVSGKYLFTGPGIVGLGAMLAAVCCPQIALAMRQLILMQARKSELFNGHNQPHNVHALGASMSALPSPTCSDYSANNVSSSELSGPTLEDLSRGKAFSFKRYISKTARGLLIPSKPPTSPTISNIDEGQNTLPSATLFPIIPLYYKSEMQFVTSLIAVSERLATLNRSGCLKALHAELCLINHNLPASVCIPSWCSEHHRVLSVLPYESSVLNSAERVPYIVFIEVINGMDDFEFEKLISETKSSVSESDSEAEFEEDSNEPGMDRSRSPVDANGLLLTMAESQSQEKIATASGLVDVTERMRTAAVMLAQLARQSSLPTADLSAISIIRARIINEMEQLEKDRVIDILHNSGKLSRPQSHGELLDEKATEVQPVIDRRDPSAAIFKEDWAAKKRRIAKSSPYSKYPGWDVIGVIVKSSTDMRQEHLAYQLVTEFKNIFNECQLDIFLHPCKVLVAAQNGGLIEVVPNAISVHSIKKSILLALGNEGLRQELLTIRAHFIQQYGSHDSPEYLRASENFLSSLVGYSLLTYILQIRDRHNGNILIHRDGYIIHIDFGFMLSNSPGYVGFESAPFKLTADYIEMLDGVGSEKWHRFKQMFLQGLLAIRKHSDRLIILLELMMKNSPLPCFYSGEAALLQFKERLHLTLTETQIEQLVDKLMTTSALNVFTRLYDNYQYYTNGIL